MTASVQPTIPAPTTTSAAVARVQMLRRSQEISLTAVFTASIWVSCVVIGAIGIVIPYARPETPKPQPAPIQAELLNVMLSSEPLTPLDDITPPPSNVLTPPPMTQAPLPPSAPAYTPVAAPSPAIAFELPVAGPTRVVETKQAAYSAQPTEVRADSQPPVAELTFGRGEGVQPAPKYPPRAQAEGQEGIVRVEFTVGTDGRVLAAEASSRSPWPLLNEAAVKVIREKWRFSAGPVRRRVIELEFSLRKKI